MEGSSVAGKHKLMPESIQYEVENVTPGQTPTELQTAMNVKGAAGWELAEVDGHQCTWKKSATGLSDVVAAIEAQSSGSSSLTTFSVSLSTSSTTLSDNSGNKVQLINTDATRTLYYRADGSSDAWVPIGPLKASPLLLLTNSNLLEMKCDLLTATVYGIVYP